MKIYDNEVQALLKTALDPINVNVWDGIVPENASLPAVSWYNIGYQNDRIVSGCKLNDKMSFRVVVVANGSSALDESVNAIGELDNTSNADFQRIEVVGNRLEPKETGVSVRRFMIDLNLTV